MKKRNKLLTVLALTMACASIQAKSLVIKLNNGMQVFYKMTKEQSPRMVIANDGTFTLNTTDYNFSDVKSFFISDTDFQGDPNTTNGIAVVEKNIVDMQGKVSVYTLDGKVLNTKGNLRNLPAGTYIISNGTRTFKIQKP